MASFAACAGLLLAMTFHAASHGRHVSCLAHDIHLTHRAMAHLALHASFQMSAMAPVHESGNHIDANPRHRLMVLVELSEFTDHRFLFRYGLMTSHAYRGAG